jgi:MarR family transcriptional regulator, lower aerobic nicotinate degradation pathway regulator
MTSISGYNVGAVLGDVGQRTGFLLSILGQDAMQRSRDALARHGLKPRQLRILDLLADHGATGQRELGNLMAIDHSILVGMLNPLETDKLVKRERDPEDRRRHVVSITAAGKRRLAQADRSFRKVEEAFLRPLNEEQRAQLRGLLLALAAGFDVEKP